MYLIFYVLIQNSFSKKINFFINFKDGPDHLALFKKKKMSMSAVYEKCCRISTFVNG